jgi:hypothetical protein
MNPHYWISPIVAAGERVHREHAADGKRLADTQISRRQLSTFLGGSDDATLVCERLAERGILVHVL